MQRGRKPIVDMEPEIAITPVQRPAPVRLGVAQPGDGKPCPLRAGLRTPGRPALHDRQMPRRDVTLHPYLVADVRGNALLTPAPHPCYV